VCNTTNRSETMDEHSVCIPNEVALAWMAVLVLVLVLVLDGDAMGNNVGEVVGWERMNPAVGDVCGTDGGSVWGVTSLVGFVTSFDDCCGRGVMVGDVVGLAVSADIGDRVGLLEVIAVTVGVFAV